MSDAGDFEGVLAQFTDLSDRRAAIARQNALAAVVETSEDAIISRGTDGIVRTWNPAAERLFQYSADEVTGKHISLLNPPELRARLAEVRADVDRGANVDSLIVPAMRKDGSRFEMSVRVSRLLDADGQVQGASVVVRDISAQRNAETALRRAEEQLRQAQRLESVGRLAGGVAHDFNNLLTVILSCTEQLESDLRSSGTANLEDVEEVREAGARAGDLTGQLLAFSRRQVLTPQALSLDEVLASSEKLLRRVLGEDIALVVRPGSAPWAIFADRGQLDQIFVNLAVNARDAMPDGGTLTVETATEPAGGKGPGEWVCLRVTDSGTGMSPEVRERLFEPFFTTKPVGKGTGLGLATVHGIVSQSGGVIRVDSALGRGTTFEVCFPRSMAAPARPASGPLPMALRGTETVLLIEDDAQVRGITAQALQKAGYKVLVAADGEQAVGLFGSRSTSIDLVISDVVMPGMNGRRTVEELRRSSPDLKALFVSGYTHDVISGRGVLDSGLQFLSKPFTPNTLLARVREVLAAKVS
jgi:PAS domain S-box-containing protein